MSIVLPIVNVVEINIPRKAAPKRGMIYTRLHCEKRLFFSSWPFEQTGMQTWCEVMPRKIRANQVSSPTVTAPKLWSLSRTALAKNIIFSNFVLAIIYLLLTMLLKNHQSKNYSEVKLINIST